MLCVLTQNFKDDQCKMENLLQVLNLRGGYYNFLNIKSTLCINSKPQRRSVYFTLNNITRLCRPGQLQPTVEESAPCTFLHGLSTCGGIYLINKLKKETIRNQI